MLLTPCTMRQVNWTHLPQLTCTSHAFQIVVDLSDSFLILKVLYQHLM